MAGMSETTEPEENDVAPVLTTPGEWRDFLERYGELYVRVRADDEEVDDLLDDEQSEARDRGERVEPWLGEPPAGEEALAASEERLGVRFPPSLRAFFLASDGWTRLDGWVDGIHPCDRVVWMRDSEAGGRVIGIYASIPGNEDEVRLFRRSIEIARGEDYWLLDPTDVGPDGEWAAYEFAPKYGDLTDYPGFSALVHSGYESMEEDAEVEDEDAEEDAEHEDAD
ncbi:SMI1/KNR4 family protein [Streptomyces californicus]|uniref:SMI1/KNR4 family protein n=1 Tax=Streptomyces californicus TaxID=67351 RepID=UPI00378EF5DE